MINNFGKHSGQTCVISRTSLVYAFTLVRYSAETEVTTETILLSGEDTEYLPVNFIVRQALSRGYT